MKVEYHLFRKILLFTVAKMISNKRPIFIFVKTDFRENINLKFLMGNFLLL